MGGRPLRLGLAGAGRLATRFHLPALRRIPGVAIAAIAEGRSDSWAGLRSIAPGSVLVPSWEDLLDKRHALDAVVNCLPTSEHASSAERFVQAGIPLYLEKPLAASLAEAEALFAIWSGTAVPCQMGFNFRFHPDVERARRLIEAGALGQVVGLECLVGNPPRPGEPDEDGLAQFRDLAVHHIDLARHLLSTDFETVGPARAALAGSTFCDAVTRCGVGVRLAVSSAPVRLDRVTIIGTAGEMTIDRFGAGLTCVLARKSEGWRMSRIRTGFALALGSARQFRIASGRAADPSYSLALRSFIGSIRSGTAPEPDMLDGLRAAQVVDAAARPGPDGRVGEAVRPVPAHSARAGPG